MDLGNGFYRPVVFDKNYCDLPDDSPVRSDVERLRKLVNGGMNTYTSFNTDDSRIG